MKNIWLHVSVIALLLSVVDVASAQTDSPADKEGAQRFEEGQRLYHLGDYNGAEASFRQAYAITPYWFILRNLAVTELKLGKGVDALRHLQVVAANPKAQHRPEVQRDLDAAYAATAHLSIVASQGASIAIDDAPVSGMAPLSEPVDVLPGHHTVEARLGERSQRVDVDAKAGIMMSVRIEFAAAPETPPSESPSRRVPPALFPAESDIGSRLAPGSVQEERTSGVRWIVSAALVSLGVGSLVLGGVFLARASDEAATEGDNNRSARAVCSQPPSSIDCTAVVNAANAAASDRNIATGFFIGGGSLVATGVVTWLLWPKSLRGDSHASLSPMVVASGAGLQWAAEWQ